MTASFVIVYLQTERFLEGVSINKIRFVKVALSQTLSRLRVLDLENIPLPSLQVPGCTL